MHLLRKVQGSRSKSTPIQFSEQPSTKLYGPTLTIGTRTAIWIGEKALFAEEGLVDLPFSVTLLLATYFAYGLSYPRPYVSVMTFLHSTCVEFAKFTVSSKLTKLINDYCQL